MLTFCFSLSLSLTLLLPYCFYICLLNDVILFLTGESCVVCVWSCWCKTRGKSTRAKNRLCQAEANYKSSPYLSTYYELYVPLLNNMFSPSLYFFFNALLVLKKDAYCVNINVSRLWLLLNRNL